MSNDIRAVCVIGWPVEHSRSPLIHNFWIGQHALTGEYRREAVTPEEFPAFVKELAQRGYAGANVTIPHKEAAMTLSEPDDRAQAVGAANTLWFEGDTLRSTNTDVEGFLANLDQMAPDWDRGLDDAIVLGAGGASRAIVYGLLSRGVKTIRVANRTFARAESLRERFGEQGQAGRMGRGRRTSRRCGPSGEYHLARHEGPARARSAAGGFAQERGGRRYRLFAADHAAAAGGEGSGAASCRRARHAAASGGARLFALVRRQARR